MKLSLVLAALLIAAVSMTAAQNRSNVTYVDHDKVAAALASGGNLVTAPDLSISMNRRTAAGQVEVHDKETDTFYVLDGEASFVTNR